MILFQYPLVLFISGILLGSIVGSILGFIHVHVYMRDHIFEFQFIKQHQRIIKKILPFFNKFIISYSTIH